MKNCFIDETGEYRIQNMFPKRPWKNYAWNDTFVSSFDQFGFGMSRFQDTGNYHKQILMESDNRLIFLRDNASNEYYSVNRNYDAKPFEVFETYVGQGYSRVESTYKGISAKVTFFVPSRVKAECWELQLENRRAENCSMDIFAYANIDMGITPHTAYTGADFEKKLNGILCTHKAYLSPTKISSVFFSTNADVYGFETTNRRFRGEYGEIRHPIALNQDKLNSEGTCFENDLGAVLQIRISLLPGERKKILFLLGAAVDGEEAQTVCKSLLHEKCFIQELTDIKDRAVSLKNKLAVHTPDDAVNRRVNIWLKRQMALGAQWGRLYGKGFRDILQDIIAFLPLDPGWARQRILYALEYQRENGNPIRQWEPLVAEEYADGAVWLIYAVNAYLKETGDWEILSENVRYFESDIKESVLNHCIRGIRYLQREVGRHGLCLWKAGDWNDSLNGCGNLGKGESVWLSQAAVKAADELVELLNTLGENRNLAEEIAEHADSMRKSILDCGWDKDHFLYGINDYGEKIGAYDFKEGQLFLNSQTWAVIAGIVAGEEAKKLMDLVEEKLSCKYGYVQQTPSYTHGSDRIGRVSYFQPGCYENGSVYNHGVAFKVIADCEIGEGNRALQTIQKIMPENSQNSYEHSGMEPYAISNMYLGPECTSRRGEAPLSWITGAAGWLFRGIVENIIGVYADYNGLRVKPTLPDEWHCVQLSRHYRNCIYDFTIENNGQGEYSLLVDGNKIDGNQIPVFADQRIHKVLVRR